MVTAIPQLGRKRVYRSSAIHLWRFSLTPAEKAESWARALLSPKELERAARFCRPHDGIRFLFCRACAKTILAAHRSDVHAGDIVFSYGPWGKPYWRDLPFSISHSGTEALLAVCEGCPIGCDIQWTGSAVDARGIADFFHPQERLALDALAAHDYTRSFYHMWVRKEAVMKACGMGLSAGIDRILVSGEANKRRASIQRALPHKDCHWWAPCTLGRDGYAVGLAIPDHEAPRRIIRHHLALGDLT